MQYLEEMFEDNPGFAEEWRIHTFEIGALSLGMQVSVQSLFGTLTCDYLYPDGTEEQFVIEKVADNLGDYLCIWRMVNGWRYRVNTGCVPISHAQLLVSLRELPDAEPFLALLEEAAMRQLAGFHLSLDHGRSAAVLPE